MKILRSQTRNSSCNGRWILRKDYAVESLDVQTKFSLNVRYVVVDTAKTTKVGIFTLNQILEF